MRQDEDDEDLYYVGFELADEDDDPDECFIVEGMTAEEFFAPGAVIDSDRIKPMGSARLFPQKPKEESLYRHKEWVQKSGRKYHANDGSSFDQDEVIKVVDQGGNLFYHLTGGRIIIAGK